MNKIHYVLIGFLLLNSFLLTAQYEKSLIWTDVKEDRIELIGERQIVPNQYRLVNLNVEALQNVLAQAPERFSEAAKTANVLIDFPLPETDRYGTFRIMEVKTMEAELQASFPNCRTYLGVNVENPVQRIRFDWTSQGFHGMVLQNDDSKGSFFIDPYQTEDIENYVCYYKQHYLRETGFKCESHSDEIEEKQGADFDYKNSTGDCQLRSYRLAMAAMGEYTDFHGSVANAQAAIVTIVNRVNEIYEVDLAVTFNLVANNNLVLFTDGPNDPYHNTNVQTMMANNQTTLDNIIGATNYDIGHVLGKFSDPNGYGIGLSGVGVVCNSGLKAYGLSAHPNPINDPFAVDMVCHELSHQLGGNHTFNNSCSGNLNSATAMETGSGSTILSYAGICFPSVQANSDPYFHGISVEEIVNFTNNSSGNNCAQLIATGNTAPSVEAGNNYVIPVSTPFELTAIGSDLEGDILTYCWEQVDNEVVAQPPLSTTTSGPNFRSLSPTTLAVRTFPSMDDVLNNASDIWEVLPSVSRDMNFRVTARDNNPNGGCTDFDEMTVTTTASSGPFLVNTPNTNNLIWDIGSNETVEWAVANTNLAPVSCANVDILLSTDGGITFPYILASGVANDGSENITVPNNASTNCRVKVVCSDNIFFDVSDHDFTIQTSSLATFSLATTGNVYEVCGTGTLIYGINVNAISGFSDVVMLSASGGPSGVSFNFGANSLVPSNTTTLLINIPAGSSIGTYPITITATGNGITKTTNFNIIVNAPPAQTSLTSPVNGTNGVALNPTLSWSAVSLVTGYTLDVATDPAFTNVIETVTTSTNSWTMNTTLDPLTTYYWRVFSGNSCGLAASSNVFSFQTATPALTYCTVGSVNATHEWIESVILGPLNNMSGSNGGYGDFTSIVVDLEIGNTYPFTLTPGYAPGEVWPEYWRVWIDFNQDGNFGGPNEKIYDSGVTSMTSVSGTFTVPTDAVLGNTRMRIGMEWNDGGDPDSNGPPLSCEILGWGEFEDYTINILPDPTCPDSDADGICDASDQCPGGNDLLDNNGNGIPDDCESTEVNLKVFLQGGFNAGTGLMRTSLAQQGIMPTSQPYGVAPYYYGGVETTTLTNQMVDWVLVEVRSGPNPSDFIERKAGILMEDGSIKNSTGVNGLTFDLPLNNTFYFVVRHRNHLDIMSSVPVARSLNVSYDFTASIGQAMGSQQQVILSNGKSALFAGDVNQDFVIQVTDYDQWKVIPAIVGTYEDTDMNLDGTVQTTDYDTWFPNKAKLATPEVGF